MNRWLQIAGAILGTFVAFGLLILEPVRNMDMKPPLSVLAINIGLGLAVFAAVLSVKAINRRARRQPPTRRS